LQLREVLTGRKGERSLEQGGASKGVAQKGAVLRALPNIPNAGRRSEGSSACLARKTVRRVDTHRSGGEEEGVLMGGVAHCFQEMQVNVLGRGKGPTKKRTNTK